MASTEFKKGDNVCLHNFSVTDTFDKQHKTVPAVTNRLQSSSIEVCTYTQYIKKDIQCELL